MMTLAQTVEGAGMSGIEIGAEIAQFVLLLAVGLVLLQLRTTITEAVRVQSEKRITEHEIVLRELHKRRVETVFGTFDRLTAFYSAVMRYVQEFGFGDGLTPEQRKDKAYDAACAMKEFYTPRQIFLPKETACRVDDIMSSLIKAARKFAVVERHSGAQDTTEVWQKIDSNVREDVRSLIEQLETEFRSILGEYANLQENGIRPQNPGD